MSVDETLLCSFQVIRLLQIYIYMACMVLHEPSQILKPAEKKAKYPYGGMQTGRPVTPPRKQKKKDANKMG